MRGIALCITGVWLLVSGCASTVNSSTTRLASPPAAGYSNQDRVMRAAVQRYPELVGESRHGTYQLGVVLRADGTIFDSELRFLTEERFANSLVPIAEQRQEMRDNPGDGRVTFQPGQKLADAGAAADEIQIYWAILPEGYDETRIAGRVNDVVRATRSHLMLPTGDLQNPDMVYTDVNLLTIFLTEDGQIAREAVESIALKALLAMNPRPPSTASNLGRVLVPPRVPVDAFQVLGLEAEQIGQTGYIVVQPQIGQRDPTALSPDELTQAMRETLDGLRYRPILAVRYAWPRRPGEPIGGYPQPMPAP